MKHKEEKVLNIRIQYLNDTDMKEELTKMIRKINNGSVCGEVEHYKLKGSYVIEKSFSDLDFMDEVKGEIKKINGKIYLTFMSRL